MVHVLICKIKGRDDDIDEYIRLVKKCGYPYTLLKFRKQCMEKILRESLIEGLHKNSEQIIIMLSLDYLITPVRLKSIVDSNEFVSNTEGIICCTKRAAEEILNSERMHDLVDCGCKEILQSLPDETKSNGISGIVYIAIVIFIILAAAWAALYIGPRG